MTLDQIADALGLLIPLGMVGLFAALMWRGRS